MLLAAGRCGSLVENVEGETHLKSPRKTALIAVIVIAIIGVLGGVFAVMQHHTAQKKTPRIVATTYAVVQMADKLKLPLVGIPSTENKIPARYAHVQRVGNPMNPSAEKIASLHPTAVYSVTTLKDQFDRSFKQQHIDPHFLNLQSVNDLKTAVSEMGRTYDRQKEAKAATTEINTAIAAVEKRADQATTKPRVLILMGLPGAGYMIATNRSYVGNLVTIAGGKNVFSSNTQEFIQPNDEAIKKANPQVILRLAHAMPKTVIPQFNSEFKSNQVWRETSAVKQHRVYDLQEPNFDATANMRAAEALKLVSNWLYPRS